MGTIRPEVREQHLSRYPDEERILKPFLPCYYVNWARRRRAYNTELSVYFLNPEPFMAESFGLDHEIMLVYSPFDRLEPRTIQAAESFLMDDPARGRVERFAYYLVSEAEDAVEWVLQYTSIRQESHIIIPFRASDLRERPGDAWFVRNQTLHHLYARDLFDVRLPLERDTYFFGRAELAVNLFDSIKRSENRGIFGLRKTGKTSLLFKLERMLKATDAAHSFYYDCKMPSIRKLRWFELLYKMATDVARALSLPLPARCNESTAPDDFVSIVSQLSKPVVFIFDEIEYISPVAILDTHWHNDFVDFWQTFWACQSRYRTISAILAGVNPSVVEADTVNRVQNPLFGIVSYDYLTGLNQEETRNMIRTLGKRMGLNFQPDACEYLYERYGGHPLLTRMACSVLNTMVKESNQSRPVTITRSRLEREEEARDAELIFYCRHVVSELKQFYPDEYTMLEWLATRQIVDFMELASYPEYVKHLRSYGLLSTSASGHPCVAIPVIGRYVALESARAEGRQTLLRVIPGPERESWLERRKRSITKDLRLLEQIIKKENLPLLFGPNSFPQADEFERVRVVNNERDFQHFINTCNKCFVESIVNYGESVGKRDYFFADIRNNYAGLWDALNRIRVYRNECMHLTLTERASEALLVYLRRDLEGRSPGTVRDAYFILQQCILDGLLVGIQIELNNLD